MRRILRGEYEFKPSRQFEWFDEQRSKNGQLAPLRRRPCVDLPLVVDLDESVEGALPSERQLDLRPECEDLVLPADENARKALDLVLAQLQRRIVVESHGQAALEEVCPNASLEVHGVPDFRFAVFLL